MDVQDITTEVYDLRSLHNFTEKKNAAYSANMETDKLITDVHSIIEEKSHATSNNFHDETELQQIEQLVTNSIQNDDKHEQIRELKEHLDQIK